MTAYELADDLEGWCDDVLSNQNRKNVFKKHAKMLRQQADRIAELEKEKKTEPFIWLKQDFDGEWIEVFPNKGIPLYTTPQTKPLSDEEMKELINNFPIIFSPQDLLSFARAIEERHGIK